MPYFVHPGKVGVGKLLAELDQGLSEVAQTVNAGLTTDTDVVAVPVDRCQKTKFGVITLWRLMVCYGVDCGVRGAVEPACGMKRSEKQHMTVASPVLGFDTAGLIASQGLQEWLPRQQRNTAYLRWQLKQSWLPEFSITRNIFFLPVSPVWQEIHDIRPLTSWIPELSISGLTNVSLL